MLPNLLVMIFLSACNLHLHTFFHLQYGILFFSGEGRDLRLNVKTLYGATHIHVNNVESNAWNVDLQPIFEGIFWVLSLVPREQTTRDTISPTLTAPLILCCRN